MVSDDSESIFTFLISFKDAKRPSHFNLKSSQVSFSSWFSRVGSAEFDKQANCYVRQPTTHDLMLEIDDRF